MAQPTPAFDAAKLQSGLDEEMGAKLSKLKADFSGLRTGRASPSLIEDIKVEYYNTMTPLKQVAAISVPEGRTLEVRPWDITALEAIEKALNKSDLGVPPQSDGKIIRLTMPTMTEQRRLDMVKMIRKIAEEAKVGVRNVRRDFVEKIKNAEKAKQISQDDQKRHEATVQKVTDAYVAKIDDATAVKEKEVTTI